MGSAAAFLNPTSDVTAMKSSSSDIDVVITLSSRTDIHSLFAAWKPILKPHHLIIVVEESEDQPENEEDDLTMMMIPREELHCDIFTKRDAQRLLASQQFSSSSPVSSSSSSGSGRPSGNNNKHSVISLSSLLLNPFKGSACRSFGFLVSKARYVFTFDSSSDSLQADVVPAKDAATGELLDPIQQHATNLRTSATPFYFNTLYDPFRPDSGFVRGYPFSLRLGVSTCLSHGSALGVPDYDTPTSIVKPHERTTRYVDAIVTVPKGCLFPMSAVNLAFDRRKIGACMLLRLGIGSSFDSSDYSSSSSSSSSIDDVWAGLCTKVVADHLGLGVKTGIPYVWRGSSSSAAGGGSGGGGLASLRSDFKPLLWLEEIVPFFQALRLPRTATTAEDCYSEIAKMVKGKLRSLDPSFDKVAAAMEAWAEAWRAANSL